MAYLEIKDLTKSFPRARKSWFAPRPDPFIAVNKMNFTMERGEILGVVGESGCGKSTLSKMIMQLLAPSAGSVWLEGENLSSLSKGQIRKRRLDFQMVFQDPYASLNPRMTVFSTLAEAIKQRYPKINKLSLQTKVEENMQRAGLDPQNARKYPHEFSGGQRQRIAIARALAPEPKLIIADEPVSALDVSIQSQILNLLKSLQRDLQLSMIFISHDLAVVHYIADRILVMQQGQCVECAPASELFYNPQKAYTQQLIQAIPSLS